MSRARPETITAVENGPIHLPAHVNTREVRDRIMEVASRLGDRVVIQKGRQLHAGPVAGVLDAGVVRVQVLPKTYDGATDRENAEFLFRLLSVSGELPRGILPGARIDTGRVDVLESVLRLLSRQLESLLVRGLPRRYYPLRELSPVVRGHIDLPRLMRRGGLVATGIPVEYAPLRRDNPLTRLLRALVLRLHGVARSSTTRALLSRADHLLEEGAARLPLTPQLVAGVRVGRYEQAWQPFVEFAGQLVQGRAPNPAGVGAFQAVGWMFPLELLYQGAVRRALTQALVGNPLQVEPSAGLHLLTTPTGASAVRATPDYVLADGGVPVLIADAKWKRLDDGGEAHGLKAADVYQMSAYMTRFGVSCSLLLYPRMTWMPPDWTEAYEFQNAGSTGRRLTLGAVDIRPLVSGGAEAASARERLLDLVRSSL